MPRLAAATVETITAPIKDSNAEAQSLIGAASAITQLATAIQTAKSAGLQVDNIDVKELMRRFDIPISALPVGKPTLTLLTGGADLKPDEAAKPVADNRPDATETENAADSALNGAQVESLIDVVTKVATGQIPRDSGLAIIKRAFNVSDDEANAMIGSAGESFTPAPPPDAPPDEQVAV